MINLQQQLIGCYQNGLEAHDPKFLTWQQIVYCIRNDKSPFTAKKLSWLKKNERPIICQSVAEFRRATFKQLSDSQRRGYLKKDAVAEHLFNQTDDHPFLPRLKAFTIPQHVFMLDYDFKDYEKGKEKYTKENLAKDIQLRDGIRNINNQLRYEHIQFSEFDLQHFVNVAEKFHSETQRVFDYLTRKTNTTSKPFLVTRTQSGGLHIFYRTDEFADFETTYQYLKSRIESELNSLNLETSWKIDKLPDWTRMKYMHPDPHIYFDTGNQYQIDEDDISEFKTVQQPAREKVSIDYSSLQNIKDIDQAVEWCHQHAIKNVGEFENLNSFKDKYLAIFNLVGIPLEKATARTLSYFNTLSEYTSNPRYNDFDTKQRIRHFYQTYRHQHGKLKLPKKVAVEYHKHYTLRNDKKLTYLQNLEIPAHCLLVAETGMGKTTKFCEDILNSDRFGLLVVPTQDALKDVQRKYKCAVYYQQQKDNLLGAKFIVSTYASFAKVIQKIDCNDYDVCVDEIHNCLTSASIEFRNKELNTVLRNLDSFKSVLLMTGTWISTLNPEFDNYYKIRVKWQQPIEKKWNYHVYNSGRKFEQVIKNIQQFYSKMLHLIYLDDKREDAALGRLLQTLNKHGYTRDQILLLNADQKKNQQYQQFMRTGKTDRTTKIIITTKISVEALNFFNRDFAAFHVLTPLHPVEIQQLYNRPRVKLAKMLIYYVSHKMNQSDKFIDQTFVEKLLIEAAKNGVNLLYNRTNDYQSILNNVQRIHLGNSNANIYGYENGQHTINFLGISYNANAIVKNACHRNPKLMQQYLAEWDWQHVDFKNELETTEADIAAEMKQLRKSKKQQIDEWIKVLKKWSYEGVEGYCEVGGTNNTIQNSIYFQFWRLLQIFKYDTALKYLQDIRDSDSKYQTLRDQCKIELMKQRRELHSNEVEYTILDEVYKTFEVGKCYSADDIMMLMIMIFRKNQGIANDKVIDGWSQNYTMNLLKKYCSVKRKRMRDCERRYYVFEIVAHSTIAEIFSNSTFL